MFERLKARVLRLMRVPHEPDPPTGAPGSLRVFRAGLNHYRLRVLAWAVGQSGALVGIGFSIVFLGALEAGIERGREEGVGPSAPVTVVSSPAAAAVPSEGSAIEAPNSGVPATAEPGLSREQGREERRRALRDRLLRISGSWLPLIWLFEVGGLAVFVAQLLVTYVLVRLEFEQHWYIVTDRSLRIRTGILRLQESTMSFANVQQVEIRQGPLQRLLGLADVCVRSAGGGESSPGGKGHAPDHSLHMGVFEGVTNAEEIRNLILDRLRAFREAGLGDPDEPPHPGVLPTSRRDDVSSVERAASRALEEARALRESLQRH